MIASEERSTHDAAWLLRLRWMATAGQLLTVGFVHFALQVPLPLAPLAALIALTAATNGAFAVWLRRQPMRGDTRRESVGSLSMIFSLMGFDLLSLTALLHLTGGPANPFIVFYFVNLALSALVLPARWCWCLAGIALACAATLFFYHQPMEVLRQPPIEDGRLSLRGWGQLTALSACATVIVLFVTRIANELRRREEQLRDVETRRARAERQQALTTMAAGAGHELATPLSTIAVVAGELARHLEDADVPDSVLEDVTLIRSELEHCRAILDRMTGQAGQAAGEELSPLPLEELLEESLAGLRQRERVRVSLAPQDRQRQLLAPLQGLALALRNVLQNALDASEAFLKVDLRFIPEEERLRIEVRDRGAGMSPATLAQAAEPFFTTKEPGRGMGLGLFLTRGVIDRLGGDLKIDSMLGRGTTVTMLLPWQDGSRDVDTD